MGVPLYYDIVVLVQFGQPCAIWLDFDRLLGKGHQHAHLSIYAGLDLVELILGGAVVHEYTLPLLVEHSLLLQHQRQGFRVVEYLCGLAVLFPLQAENALENAIAYLHQPLPLLLQLSLDLLELLQELCVVFGVQFGDVGLELVLEYQWV